MNRLLKAIVVLCAFILISLFVLAVDFSPQGDIDLKNRYGVFNGTYGNFTYLYQGGSPVIDLSTGVSWVNLTDYPAACPSGSYLTELDDSVTCTAAMKTTGDDTTGNYTFQDNLTFNEGSKICFNANCSSSIVFNGTHTVITG